MLFALTWQRVVRQMPKELLINVWYLDDGHIVGTPSQLATALEIIAREGAALGVALNPQKCKVWGPAAIDNADQSLTTLARIPRTPWASGHGLKVLGLPIDFPGSTTFGQEEVLKAVCSLEEACHVLSHLGHPHEQHVMLRYCLDATFLERHRLHTITINVGKSQRGLAEDTRGHAGERWLVRRGMESMYIAVAVGRFGHQRPIGPGSRGKGGGSGLLLQTTTDV